MRAWPEAARRRAAGRGHPGQAARTRRSAESARGDPCAERVGGASSRGAARLEAGGGREASAKGDMIASKQSAPPSEPAKPRGVQGSRGERADHCGFVGVVEREGKPPAAAEKAAAEQAGVAGRRTAPGRRSWRVRGADPRACRPDVTEPRERRGKGGRPPEKLAAKSTRREPRCMEGDLPDRRRARRRRIGRIPSNTEPAQGRKETTMTMRTTSAEMTATTPAQSAPGVLLLRESSTARRGPSRWISGRTSSRRRSPRPSSSDRDRPDAPARVSACDAGG